MAAVAGAGAAGGGGGDGAGKKASRKGLRGARRRLSVVSDNKLVEGVASLAGDDGSDKAKSKPAEHIVKTYAGVSRKGFAPYNPRKRNQDSLIMREHGPTTTLFFGVLDGHGEAGDLVSGFFAKRMPKQIFAHPKFASDPGKAMEEEQAKLERELLLDASIDTDFSGTTSVLATIRGKKLTVANVGDSRIILGRLDKSGKMKAFEVSDDHKPDRPDEQKRIEAKGGRVFAVEYEDGVDGPPRVWLGNMDIPGLAMARSLGDVVAHSAGVISTPEHHSVDLTPDDKIVVMGSDGLWEFMSNQEVIDMVVASGMKDPSDAVDILAEESAARWMREEEVIDDTTIIVAYM